MMKLALGISLLVPLVCSGFLSHCEERGLGVCIDELLQTVPMDGREKMSEAGFWECQQLEAR